MTLPKAIEAKEGMRTSCVFEQLVDTSSDTWQQNRSPAHFVVPIPDGLDLASAATMMCGGATVYSPLKRHGAGTTAKSVGVIGLGGLGHYGVLYVLLAVLPEVTAEIV